MKKGIIKPALVVTALLAGVYLVSVFFIGRQVQQEVSAIAGQLAARTDVEVVRLEYERGFLTGVLHYDLVLAPDQQSSVPQLAALAALAPEQGFPVSGSIHVLHGPLLGSQGVGIARSDWTIPWPDTMREQLSRTASDTGPLLSMTTLLSLSGQLQTTIRLADYAGDLPDTATGEALSIDFQGVAAQLSVDRDFDNVDLQITSNRFMFAVEGSQSGRFDVEQLSLSGQWQQYSPYVWTGDSAFAVDLIAAQSPGVQLAMSDIAVDTHTGVEQGRLVMRSQMTSGRQSINEFGINSAESTLSAGNINADAYNSLMTLMNQPGADIQPATLEPLLLGQPWFAIDSWRVSFIDDDDITGSLRVQLPAVATVEEVLQGLSIENELRVSTAALREFARFYLQSVAEPALVEPELTQAAERFYDDSLQTLQSIPGLDISSDYIALSASIRDGDLLIAGQPVMDVSPWLSTSMLSANASQSSGSVALDTAAAPYFGRVQLQSGFTPHPHRVELTAGGDVHMSQVMLGGAINATCAGYVSAAQPDLALEFTAGQNPLFIFLSSDADTTLVVRDPAGNWHCNDDAAGLAYNAGLQFDRPASGEYLIWTGTYDEDFADATLFVSEQGLTP